MVTGTRVCIDGMRCGTVVDSYGGPPVDLEEIVTVRVDGGGTMRVVNALHETSSHWPPRLERIDE